MKLLGIALLAVVTVPLFSKGTTQAITFTHAGRSAEITDAELLRQFGFGPGPGNCIRGEDCSAPQAGWIADWLRGSVAAPDASLQRYEVSFRVDVEQGNRRYVITYVYSPETKQGFIYLPGPGEAHYSGNVELIFRGKDWEGHWFRATSEWSEAAQRVITAMRQ